MSYASNMIKIPFRDQTGTLRASILLLRLGIKDYLSHFDQFSRYGLAGIYEVSCFAEKLLCVYASLENWFAL